MSLKSRNKPDKFWPQLGRYTIVGGISFGVDVGLLYILTDFLHLFYILSATISFIVGLWINYYLSSLWVFEDSKFTNKKIEFLLYALIGFIGLGFNNLFLWVFTHFLHIYYLWSKVLAAILVYMWNFLARKYFLYDNKSGTDRS
ncbi:GtrA family protein [Coprobacter tertius]|uniref:GtrA family protein n=1 Tax=Coprobacter tertius TaxID=2944915 RepID=A0ABT1MD51_9BACT|nr:GtrA family protein [Coprobacter tertius]